MPFFKVRNSTQQTNAKAQYMPEGLIWEAKQKLGSNFRNLLAGLCVEIARLEDKQNEIYDEMLPSQTDALISEWEALAGIPDECFPIANTIEERRENLVLKLTASMNGTKEDFENLAAVLGITVIVMDATSENTFPWSWPHIFYGSEEDAAFTMVVKFIGVQSPSTFPWSWPHIFGTDTTLPIRCLFNKLRPANVKIVYQYIN